MKEHLAKSSKEVLAKSSKEVLSKSSKEVLAESSTKVLSNRSLNERQKAQKVIFSFEQLYGSQSLKMVPLFFAEIYLTDTHLVDTYIQSKKK